MQKLRRICCIIVFTMLYIINCIISFLYILNYPAMYSLSERERFSLNMQGTMFTSAILKIVPTIKNLICKVFIMIVRCDAFENYVFL